MRRPSGVKPDVAGGRDLDRAQPSIRTRGARWGPSRGGAAISASGSLPMQSVAAPSAVRSHPNGASDRLLVRLPVDGTPSRMSPVSRAQADLRPTRLALPRSARRAHDTSRRPPRVGAGAWRACAPRRPPRASSPRVTLAQEPEPEAPELRVGTEGPERVVGGLDQEPPHELVAAPRDRELRPRIARVALTGGGSPR